jgi:hypothetical protein
MKDIKADEVSIGLIPGHFFLIGVVGINISHMLDLPLRKPVFFQNPEVPPNI